MTQCCEFASCFSSPEVLTRLFVHWSLIYISLFNLISTEQATVFIVQYKNLNHCHSESHKVTVISYLSQFLFTVIHGNSTYNLPFLALFSFHCSVIVKLLVTNAASLNNKWPSNWPVLVARFFVSSLLRTGWTGIDSHWVLKIFSLGYLVRNWSRIYPASCPMGSFTGGKLGLSVSLTT
jgi:hypothetical protein